MYGIVVMPRVLFVIVIMEMLQLFSLSPNNAKPILPRFPSAWIVPCVLFWMTLDGYFVAQKRRARSRYIGDPLTA